MSNHTTIEEFADKVTALRKEFYERQFPKIAYMYADHVDVEFGKVYARLVIYTAPNKQQPSVWGFVRIDNGDILKPASWKAPAKHARGNIFDANPLANCNAYGPAYLR